MNVVRRVMQFVLAWGVPLAAVLTALGVLADRVGVGRSLNDLAYDQFVNLDARLSFASPQVLLVYVDPELERQPDAYLRLLDQLDKLGAQATGVAALDARSWGPEPLGRLSQVKRVVLGHVETNRWTWPDGVPRGLVDLPTNADGIYRRARLRDDAGHESLESVLVNQFVADAPPLPTADEFGVSFSGGAESLPHVEATAVLNGDVTSTLVRDRIVLLGPASHPLIPGLATPTTFRGRMSVLEFHGQVLQTLVSGNAIVRAPRWLTIGIYGLVTLLFLTLSRRTHLDQAVPLFLIVWTLQAVVELLLVWRARMWVPLLSLVLIETLAGIWSFDQRMRYAERVWQVMRRRGFSVSPRYKNHPHVDVNVEPWPHIISLLQHLFPVDRIVMLACPSGLETLDVVGRAGVADEEIIERRRDIRREPYADAIDRKTPLRIDETRPFLQKLPDQCQYIAPFLHHGAVKGVVILEMSLAARDKLPGFVQQFAAVCEEVSPWIDYYVDLTANKRHDAHWWNRYTRSSEEETVSRLQRHLRSIERRLHESYGMIESAASGKAIFDLGGAAVTMNAAMFRVLHDFGLASMEARLLQVLRTLSKRDVSECRDLIRRVILQGRRERMIVTDQRGEHPMILVVQPLVKSSQVANDPDEMHAFQSHGVQLEILEGSLLSEMHWVREHVTDEGLEAIENALADVLSMSHDLAIHQPEIAVQQLKSSVQQARTTIQSCQAMLANRNSEEVDICLPVQLNATVSASLTETMSLAEQRLTTVSTAIPKDLPDVVANPHRLRQSLNTIIEVMIENARENSLINVSARSELERIVLVVENEGCGVAFDQLAAARRSRPDQVPSDVSRLHRVGDWIAAWGGDIKLESELGEGAKIEIELVRFDWSKHLVPRRESKHAKRLHIELAEYHPN